MAIVVGAVAFLVLGALTGRVKATHACCSAAAAHDPRLATPPRD